MKEDRCGRKDPQPSRDRKIGRGSRVRVRTTRLRYG